jgi:DNA-binding MarR family transcriptional regulator
MINQRKNDKLDRFTVHCRFIEVRTLPLENLQEYLKTLLGTEPWLRLVAMPNLPLFLRERFAFYRTDLFGHPWTMAIENEAWETASPGEYEKQANLLRPHFEAPVVFVLDSIDSTARQRMLQKGLPFIVPGTQCYLPGALVDFRERFPRKGIQGRDTLSPAAQLVLLFHLQRKRLDGRPLNQIARDLGYSTMTLSKVKDELEEAGLCEVHRKGRSVSLRFVPEGRELWDLAKEKLSSPVRKTLWAQWATPGYPALRAGISALSEKTMINEDRLPTYALSQVMLEGWLRKGTIIRCTDSETATVKMEGWAYEPKLLGDNLNVDVLSLYLSLRDSHDERVQKEMEQLIQGVHWHDQRN